MAGEMTSEKLLILVRHAKSSWNDLGLSDRDRPLNKRGRRDAPDMARRLSRLPQCPERIVTSPACRALSTAEVLAAEFGLGPEAIQIEETLYEAGPMDVFRVVHGLNNRLGCAMLVGHNPGLTQTVNDLANVAIENVPTCGVAILRFEIGSWTEVRDRSATLVDFDYPKKVFT